MKLQKIKSICKEARRILLFEAASYQWISNGYAAYPCYNLPRLNEENIFAIFDIPDSDKGKIIFIEKAAPEKLDFDDCHSGEVLLERYPLAIRSHGQMLLPLNFAGQVVYINEKFLTPFSDIKEGYELYGRIDSEGKPYVAVKTGMILLGIISRSDIVTRNEDFVPILREFLDSAETEIKNNMIEQDDNKSSDLETDALNADEESDG